MFVLENIEFLVKMCKGWIVVAAYIPSGIPRQVSFSAEYHMLKLSKLWQDKCFVTEKLVNCFICAPFVEKVDP